MSNRTSTPERVTVIKEGGMGGMLLGFVVAIALAFGVWYVITGGQTVGPTDAKIGAAAEKVGEAADKVGNAVDKAVR